MDPNTHQHDCPVDPNADQADTDEDGLGNACDPASCSSVPGGANLPPVELLAWLIPWLAQRWRRARRRQAPAGGHPTSANRIVERPAASPPDTGRSLARAALTAAAERVEIDDVTL